MFRMISKLLIIQSITLGLGLNKQVKSNRLFPRDFSVKQSGRFVGVNVAGLEFGMNPDGTITNPISEPPLNQIDHFRAENVNTFRIPVAWQRLQPEINGPLDQQALGVLKKYVNHITLEKGSVIIDLHNYARRDGKIIGEDPDLPADSLANFWSKIAKEFKDQDEDNIFFGLMNEPHNVKLEVWVKTLQLVVNSIRNTGAKNNIILPGDNWCHINNFIDSYHTGMSKIQNPDGSYQGLIFDLHEYFDGDGSGSGTICTASRVEELKVVVDLLKKSNRQAIITEFGGSKDPSCISMLSEFIEAATNSYPEIMGYTMWGAGAFSQDYPLVITIMENNQWIDQENFKVIRKFLGSGEQY